MKMRLVNFEITNFMSLLGNYCKTTLSLAGVAFTIAITSSSALAGWEVQWIDRFEGTGVNWNKWTAHIQANFNNEVQCYTDDDSSVNKNYDVSDGTLKIIARRQSISCPGLNGQQREWTSGRLNGKDKSEFLYGRIESRIRFHNLEGGTWPAFWMLENRIAEDPIKGDNDTIRWPNPGAGEIDVWEWFSNRPDNYITNFFNTGSCGAEVLYNYPGGSPDVLQWQKYAIEWNENNISFFINDIMVTSHDVSNCAQYKEPMFVLLNVAMGGALGGNIDAGLNLATMEVDYVAHCTATATNDSAFCDESTSSALDDDVDGINNQDDLCPDSPVGASVDVNGCAAGQEANVAPQVSLSISQNGLSTSVIKPANGLVTINAAVSDANDGDSFTVNWNLDELPDPIQDNLTVSFDPTSMPEGDYTVSIEVSDDGFPVLSNVATLPFEVFVNFAPIAVAAGPSGSVFEGTSVALSANGSSDPDQDGLQYSWAQTAGPQVTLSNANISSPSFNAPNVDADTTLTFTVEVSDGNLTDISSVDILIRDNPNAIQVSDVISSKGGSIGALLLAGLLLFRQRKSVQNNLFK
ncbi:MAG: beta-glucanase (GH16 family) [Paraglaciecola sp.]|jgi:beta-glucanase (GH16 family)